MNQYKQILPGIFFICCPTLFIAAQSTRDAYKWPFSKTSIWNTPVGSNAKYVPANLQPATASGVTIDEDYIVMSPKSPAISIFESNASWNRDKDRCIPTGRFLFKAPIPVSFIVSHDTWDGATPNAGLAVLMPDGKTIKQTQPFAHCNLTDTATSEFNFADEDISGEGRGGAHGGSGLSAIGGAIRIGELVPGGEIKHVLKINLFAKKNISRFAGGYRWPANKADGGWDDPESGNYYNGQVEACRIGSLLAIRPKDYERIYKMLLTDPAKILLKTLRDYGAYTVDNTGWDVYCIITEWGPAGRVSDEFKQVWGFDIKSNQQDPWYKDIATIHKNLYVIDNNGPATIGGGGTKLVALAPDFGRPGNKIPSIKIAVTKEKSNTIITANATDSDGAISYVNFYCNNILIATVYKRPFKINFKKLNEGENRFLAKAIDNEEAIGISNSVKITNVSLGKQ